jgi:N-methylhydantoinase B/oxoprolinase/acetone carboxylase alpha subunit
VATIAHHADIGGVTPGGMPGDTTDIHQEGFILPPVKLFRAGEPDPEVWRVLLANTRTADSSSGDFMAMYGSLVTGERRIDQLVPKYGLPVLRTYMKEIQNYSERRMRAAIREIPNGIYSAEIFADDDGVSADPYRIAMAMHVLDEDVVIDFHGSDEQAKGPINCPFGVTLAACANALFNVADPSIPHNQGAFRPLHVIAPPGTIVNCDYPAALSAGNTESHNLVAEVVMSGFRQAVPARIAAPTGATTGLITGGGVRPWDGEFFAFVIWEPTGYGARVDKDGYTITTWVAPQARQFPTEVIETEQPWRVLRYELRKDSAGAGRTRGGLGLVREYEMLSDGQVVNSIAHFHRFSPAGVDGGAPGQPLEVRIRNAEGREQTAIERTGCVSPAKFSQVRVDEGESLVVRMPGGGGWGDPRARDRDAVRRDLRDELISPAAAVELYGLGREEAERICCLYSWERRRGQESAVQG